VASVIALTDCLLYALDKEPFVLLLTGHPVAAREAQAITSGHVGPQPDPFAEPAAD